MVIKIKFKELFDELESKNQALSDTQIKLESIIGNLVDAVIIISNKGIIEYFNHAAEKMFFYDSSEVIGKNVNILMPEPHRSNHDRYIHERKENIIGGSRELLGLRKDNSQFDMELGVSEVRLKNRLIYAGIIKNITERKRADIYISNIAKIQEMYIQKCPENEIFEYILNFIINFTNSEYGFIGVIYHDEDTKKSYLKTLAITNIAWNKETKDLYKESITKRGGLEFRNLNTLFGYTIRTGETVLTNRPSEDHRSGGLPKGHPSMSSYLGMPIFGKNGLIGMYGLANKTEGYDNSDIVHLKMINTVITSIIESARSYSIIEKMANIDSLTGVYNRFYFNNFLAELIRQRNIQQIPLSFSILMIDLNKFKDVNDFYGHELGDYVLKEFAHRVDTIIKKKDLFARIGGDEFVLLLDDISYDNAGKVAQRIVNFSKKKYIFKQQETYCSASIGISCFPRCNDLNDLLRQADLALYKAKNESIGYCYFLEELQEEYETQQQLEKDINIAFEEEQFFLVFQPIVSLKLKKVVGFEALIRWKHPNKGIVSPDIFIEKIEKMYLVKDLNIYVINQALNTFNKLGFEDEIFLSINISPNIINFNEHVKDIVSIFKGLNYNKNIKLSLEITETSFIDNSDSINLGRDSNTIELLEKYNIGLTLDDFGMKYSSINRLFEYSFSTLKIDMFFVQKLVSSERQHAKTVIKAIIDIAKGLNMNIIAEGIETKEQVSILKGLGCDLIQGYYFSKPLEANFLIDILSSFDFDSF